MRQSHSILAVLLLSVFCLGCNKKREPVVLAGHDVQFRVASFERYGDWAEAKLAGTEEVIYMDSTPVLTGPDFYEVSPGMRESGEGYVSFQVWPKAAKRLQKYTEVYVDQCIAITVDGKAHRCVPIEDKFGQTFVVNCGSAHENPFELYKLVTGRD